MAPSTIAFLYPGAMGVSLAHTIHTRLPHLILLTSLSGRSKATLDRSTSSGLSDVPLPDLVARSDIIVSILPPSSALSLAQEIVDALASLPRPRTTPPVFIDANAISPGTVSELSKLLKTSTYEIPFLDGCVIGLPAREGYDPKLYLSCAPEWEAQMEEVTAVLSGGAPGKGLKVETLPGAGEGAASALKMCYGGINKGATGLAAVLVLAASAHSPGTAAALTRELSLSQPAKLEGFTKSFPDMIGKAYRWVGEMEEISSFIASSLSSRGPEEAQRAADTYNGMAQIFQRIADDAKMATEKSKSSSGSAAERGKAGEVDDLLDWAEKGKEALKQSRR